MKREKYQSVTLFDFEKLCRENMVCQYTYETVDQKWDTILHDFVLSLTGDTLFVQMHPGQIVIKGTGCELRFENVKYVRVYRTQVDGQMKFGVVCEQGCPDNSMEIEYLLSALSKIAR